ncbi:MAG: LLM class flavin-dependent oxidoreductase [Alphaproteobacteria bacterium]|nr:LLM class flavin-dependent oxidoreductase [Alphaproteobacteria bacterium]
MRFSLSLRPGTGDPVPAKDIARFSQLAESLGYYAVYITDHFYITTPNLHSVGAAAVVAGATEKIKIGFAAYQAPLRHPIAAAKELASLDILSNGRFIAGLAAGSFEPEFKALGVPFNRRGAMLEESVRAIKKLWTGDCVSFKGEFWSFENVTIHPKPIQKPHPPIWIATWTAAPRAARRVAKYADGWQASGLHTDVGTIPEGTQQIEKACAEIGRDPREIGRAYVNTVIQFGATPEKAWEALQRESSAKREKHLCLLGETGEIIRRIEAMRAHGMQELSIQLAPWSLDTMKKIADEVMPHFR